LFTDLADVEVYLDNIITATGLEILRDGDLMTHALLLVTVIDRMTSSNLWLRSEKCFVLCDTLTTLGHQVSATGVRLDPRKIAAVQEWPTPTSYKQLRAFLGLAAFLRGNIRHASELFASLHKVKDPGKDAFKLSADQHRAWEVVKVAVATAPSLTPPDFDRRFHMAIDASTNGVGGVLYQPRGQETGPSSTNIVGFCSRGLLDHEKGYSTYKLETLGLVFSLRSFDDFVSNRDFTVETDHKALLTILDHSSRVVANWLSIICEYTFDLIQVPGNTNICPDSLSRLYADSPWGCRNRFVSTTVAPQEHLLALSSAPVTDAQRQLIMAVHEQGHFGVLATMEALRFRGHTWPGQVHHVRVCLSNCATYRAWTANKARFGPLMSQLSRSPMDQVQFDLITSFGEADAGQLSHDAVGVLRYLLVVVDCFTSYTWLTPMQDKATATIAASLWLIFSRFGFPKILQSDGDATMVTDVIKEMIHSHGGEHRGVTAYNPRAMGKVESRGGLAAVTIRKLMAHSGETEWSALVPTAELCLNMRHDPTLNCTPFYALYHRHANELQDYSLVSSHSSSPTEADLDKWRQRAAFVKELLHPSWADQLEATRVGRAATVNDSRPQADILPDGSRVMWKDPRRPSKNAPPNIGPFTVFATNEPHRYILKDKRGKVVIDSVPVDQLKPLPHWQEDGSGYDLPANDEFYVEKILASRKRDGKTEYLLKWLGLDEQTWEPAAHIHDKGMIANFIAQQANSRRSARKARGAAR
jgi:hypothetical protein